MQMFPGCPVTASSHVAIDRFLDDIVGIWRHAAGVLLAKAVALLSVLFLLTDAVQAMCLWVIARLLHDESVAAHHPLDAGLARHLVSVGIVALLIVAILGVALRIGTLPIESLAAVIGVTLILFVLGAVAFSWRHWATLLSRRASARLLLIEYLAAPFRRLRIWVSAVCLAFLAFIVLGQLLPRLFAQARALPTRVETDVRVVVAPEALSQLQTHLDAETKIANLNSSDADRCQRASTSAVAWLRGLPEQYKAEAEQWRKDFSDARAAELGQTLMRVVSVVLAIACAGLIIGPLVLIGARGRRFVLMAAAALLPLPTLFVLDRMGVTSAVPWLWVAVYAPFAVADAALSAEPVLDKTKAYWIEGRMTLHSTLECPALRAIGSNRIQHGEWELLIRIGFRRCQKCLRDNIRR